MAAPKRAPKSAPSAPPAVAEAPPSSPGIGHNSGGRKPFAYHKDGTPIFLQEQYDATNKFHVPAEIIPPGFVYEWKRYSTYNQVDNAYQADLVRIGHWRPVLNETHPGVFQPLGSPPGAIIRDGMILMERPVQVHDHFVNAEKRKAAQRINDAKVQHGLGGRMAPGTDVSPSARGQTFVRTGRDVVDDAPRPTYQYDPSAID